MTPRRAVGRLLMGLGGAVFGFLVLQSADATLNAASITHFGMPGALLAGMLAIIAFSVGAQL